MKRWTFVLAMVVLLGSAIFWIFGEQAATSLLDEDVGTYHDDDSAPDAADLDLERKARDAPGARSALLEAGAWRLRGRALLPGGGPASGVALEVSRFAGYQVAGAEPLERETVLVDASGNWRLELPALDQTHVVSLRFDRGQLRSDREDVRSLAHGQWLWTRGVIPGAMDVEVRPFDGGLDFVVVDEEQRPVRAALVIDSDGRQRGVTDRAGICKVRTSSSVAESEWCVRASGFESSELRVTPPDAGASRVERVVLRAGLRFRGVVEDAAGVPIRDARVSLRAARLLGAATSDIRGRFDLAWQDFHDEELDVVAEADGYVRTRYTCARHEIEAPWRSHVLRLRASVRLAGRVVERVGDAWTAVPGARLRVVSEPRARERQEAVSDDEGRFGFASMPTGESVLLCRAPERPPFLAVLEVPASAVAELRTASAFEVRVPKSRELRVFVDAAPATRRALSAPVESASIRVLADPDGEGPHGFFELARGSTAEGGAQRFEMLPRVKLRLEVSHRDLGRAVHDVDATSGVARIALADALRAKLVVRDAALKAPIRSFDVLMRSVPERRGASSPLLPVRGAAEAGTDAAAGLAVLQRHVEAPDGVWLSPAWTQSSRASVAVEAPGFARVVRELVRRPFRQRSPSRRRARLALAPRTLNFSLEPAAHIEGRVLGGRGSRPVPRARLRVLPAKRDPNCSREAWLEATEECFTDARGEFHLRRVPPGHLRVLVEHPDFLPHESPLLSIAAGGHRRLGLELRSGVRVLAKMLALDGRTVARAGNAVLTLMGGGDKRARSTRAWSAPIRDDGTCSFAPLLGDETYRVDALARDAHGAWSWASASGTIAKDAGRLTLRRKPGIDHSIDFVCRGRARAPRTCALWIAGRRFAVRTRACDARHGRGASRTLELRGLPAGRLLVRFGRGFDGFKQLDLSPSNGPRTRIVIRDGAR